MMVLVYEKKLEGPSNYQGQRKQAINPFIHKEIKRKTKSNTNYIKNAL
jgi:hypothetical protein